LEELMAKMKATNQRTTKIGRAPRSGRFVTVNKAYVKRQADEAVETFFAPLLGAIRAATDAGKIRVHDAARPEKVGNDR
jgi:hypothetical protein